MYKEPLFRLIAQQVKYAHDEQNKPCGERGKALRHAYALENLMRHMPSGSGIDSGTKLLLEESTGDKLVFQVDYHHMNDNGYYCGWSTRQLVITPSLRSDFELDFINEDYSGVDCIDSSEEHLNEECEDEDCKEDEHYQYDNEEFISESTGEYLAETYDWALKQEYELTLVDYEPAKLSWHGELVK